MKTLWHRLTSPTPAFWRKVRAVGIVAGGVGTALAGAPAGLPAWFATLGGYLTVASGVTVALSSLTCADTSNDSTEQAARTALLAQLNQSDALADQTPS